MTVFAFAGSRDFGSRPGEAAVLVKTMRRLLEEARPGEHRVRVGDARGADALVAILARGWGIEPEIQVCHWPRQGSKQERWMAAHERNGRVLAGAERLIAFLSPGTPSSGTSDAIAQAKAAGIDVYVYQSGRWRHTPAIAPGRDAALSSVET